jgi:hypothetical protein
MRQRPKYELHRQHQSAPWASAKRPAQPPPTQVCLPRTRSSAAHARAVAPGMFPHVARRLLGEGAFDTRERTRVRTPTPRPKHPGYGAQHRVGQCKSTAEHGATSQRVRAQREAARSASGHGRCSKRRREKPGVGGTRRAAAAALTGQSADQGAASDPKRKRLLELNAQAVDSALGFGTLHPKFNFKKR